MLQANYIEVCNAQKSEVLSSAPDVKDCFDEFWSKYEACPMKGRDRILASVCPQVYRTDVCTFLLVVLEVNKCRYLLMVAALPTLTPQHRLSSYL